MGLGRRNEMSLHQTGLSCMLTDEPFAVLSVIYNLQNSKIAQKTKKGANPLDSEPGRMFFRTEVSKFFLEGTR